MISSVRDIAVRLMLANKKVMVASVISVLLTVFMVIMMSAYAFSAKQAMVQEMQKLYGEMDLSVGYNMDQEKVVDVDLISYIENLKGVDQVSAVYIASLEIEQSLSNVYTIGIDNDELSKSRYHIQADLQADEVAMNRGLAEILSLNQGDDVAIEGKRYTVKEIIDDWDATGVAPNLIMLSRKQVKNIVHRNTGADAEATYLLIKTIDERVIGQIVEEIYEYDAELRVDVASENKDSLSNLRSLNILIILLSLLALSISALVVITNFEVFMQRYDLQMSILRSNGALPSQMFKMIFFICSVVTVMGSILAFFCGLIFSFLFDEFSLWGAGITTIICMSYLQVMMLVPAYRGLKMLPLNQLARTHHYQTTARRSGKPGYYLLISGVALIAMALLFQHNGFILIAVIVIVMGTFYIFPFVLTMCLEKSLPTISKLNRIAFIAVKSIIPNIQRNTRVTMIVSLMMVVAIFGSTTLETIRQNEIVFLQTQYPTEVILSSGANLNTKIDPRQLQHEIKSMSSVDHAIPISRPGRAELKKGERYVPLSYLLVDMKELVQAGVLENVPDITADSMLVTQEFATQHGISTGDWLETGMFSVEKQAVFPLQAQVQAIVVGQLPGSSYSVYIDWSNHDYQSEYTVFHKMFIVSSNEPHSLTLLERLKLNNPELQVHTLSKSLSQSEKMFYERWAMLIAVIVLLFISAMIGANITMYNAIQTRRKEFAVLRTLRLYPKEIVRLILSQLLFYTLTGLVLGGIVGAMLTGVLQFIDPTPLKINTSLIIGLTLAVPLFTILLLWPSAKRISSANLIMELRE